MVIRRLAIWSLLLVFALPLLGDISIAALATNQVELDWAKPTGPQLSYAGDISFEQANEKYSQPECSLRQIPLKVRSRSISGKLLSRTELQYKELCVTDTNYGAVSSNYLLLEGTSVAGTVVLPPGFNGSLLPIPKSDDAFYLDGSRLSIIRNVRANIIPEITRYGENFYHIIKPSVIKPLVFPNGHRVSLDYDSRSFNASNSHLAASTEGIGIFRYNIVLDKFLLLEKPHYPTSGPSPRYKSTISPSGRFLIRNSSRASIKIFDLATCNTDLTWETVLHSCKNTDIYRYLQNQLPGSFTYKNFRFVSEGVATVHIGFKDCTGCVTTYKKYMLTPGNMLPFDQTGPPFTYLALGDSFASGEGAYNYKTTTDNGDNVCHLSLVSYPYLLSSQLNLGVNTESVACSGAVTEDLTNISDEYLGQTQKKIALKNRPRSLVESIKSSSIPGYLPQVSFLESLQPEIITLSIGGNDIGFADKIKRCLEPDTCFDTYEDRKELLNEIDNNLFTIIATYKELLTNAHPSSRLYVIGYPKIIKPNGNCGNNVKLNNEEAIFADQLTEYLNEAIEAGTKRAGAFYVDVEDALVGHRLCETFSSRVAVNGITAGNDRLKIIGPLYTNGPIGNESFHPNELGHQLLAKAIKEKTDNLRSNMPQADPDALIPTHEGRLFLDKPKSGRELLYTNYDTKANNNVFYKSGFFNQIKKVSLPLLVPSSTVRFFLKSEPTNLGTFEVSEDGSLEASVVIPESVPHGWHTLHIYGEDLLGEPYDIEQVVYVAQSREDIDGDGVLNEDELCLYGEPSGVDDDKDGIDDACDGYVGLAPTMTPVTADIPTASSRQQSQNQSSEVQSNTSHETQASIANVPIVDDTYVAIQSSQNAATPSNNDNQTKNEQKVLSETTNPVKQAKIAITPSNSKDFSDYWVWLAFGLTTLIIGTVTVARQKNHSNQ